MDRGIAGLPVAKLLRPRWAGVPRTIACHRADLDGSQPPNSLAAVEACVQAGAPRLEVDVHFLRDGTMAVFHDQPPGVEGEAAEPAQLAFEELQALWSRVDRRVRIAVLPEVVEAVAGTTTMLQVDLKPQYVLPGQRLKALDRALSPVRETCIIGTQFHENLAPLARLGFRVAFDTTRHWHYWPGRPPELGLSPAWQGLHGLWDDAPVAHQGDISAVEYVEMRIEELTALVPAASEWMVDMFTVRQLWRLGIVPGDALHARGIELAAWTVQDRGPETTRRWLTTLFDLGADTVIAHPAAIVASYLDDAL